MKLTQHLLIALAIAVPATQIGCGTQPSDEQEFYQGEIYNVAGFEGVYVINDPGLYDRICGDEDDGWNEMPDRLQPAGCGTYYYMVIDGNKGVICGPDDCDISWREMMDMYSWLAELIAGFSTPNDGS